MGMESVLLGLLALGGGVYALVYPETIWKLMLYPRMLQWPNREPMESELLFTRILGGGLALFGLLLGLGYI